MVQDESPRTSVRVWFIPAMITIVIIVLALAGLWYIWSMYPRLEDRGAIGDSIAPLTALLTVLALAWSIYSIGMQREELRLQRQELRVQYEERKASREALQQQAQAQQQQVRAQQRMERAYLLLAQTTQLSNMLEHQRGKDQLRAQRALATAMRGRASGVVFVDEDAIREQGELVGRLEALTTETKAVLEALKEESKDEAPDK